MFHLADIIHSDDHIQNINKSCSYSLNSHFHVIQDIGLTILYIL